MAEIKELLAEANKLKAEKDNKLSAIKEEHDKCQDKYLKAVQKRQDSINSGDKVAYNEAKNDVEYYQGRVAVLEREYEKVEAESVSFDSIVTRALARKIEVEKNAKAMMKELITKDLKKIDDSLKVMYSDLYKLEQTVGEAGCTTGRRLSGTLRAYSELEELTRTTRPELHKTLFIGK